MPDRKVKRQIIILSLLLILLTVFGSWSAYLLNNTQISTNSHSSYIQTREIGDNQFISRLSRLDIRYKTRDQVLLINFRSSISTLNYIQTDYGDYIFTTNGYDQFEIYINDKKIPMNAINTDIDAFSTDPEKNVFQHYSIDFQDHISVNQSLYTHLNFRLIYHPIVYSNNSMFADFTSGPDNILVDFDPIVYRINFSMVRVAAINIISLSLMIISFFYYNKIRQPRNFETREDIRFHTRYFPYFVITILTTPFLQLDPFSWIHTQNHTMYIPTNTVVPWFFFVILENLFEILVILVIPIIIEYLRRRYIKFVEPNESLYPTLNVVETPKINKEDTADRQTREFLQLKYMQKLSNKNNLFILGSILILYLIIPLVVIIRREVLYVLIGWYYLMILRRKFDVVSTNYFNPDGSVY